MSLFLAGELISFQVVKAIRKVGVFARTDRGEAGVRSGCRGLAWAVRRLAGRFERHQQKRDGAVELAEARSMDLVKAEREAFGAPDLETYSFGAAASGRCRDPVVDVRVNGADVPEIEGFSSDLSRFFLSRGCPSGGPRRC